MADPAKQTPLEAFTLAISSIADILPEDDDEIKEGKKRGPGDGIVGISQGTISQLFRAFLTKLSIVESVLLPIPQDLDVTFTVAVKTCRTIHPADLDYRPERLQILESDSLDQVRFYQGLPFVWIQADTRDEDIFRDSIVIPLKSISNEVIRMQLWVQDNKQQVEREDKK